MLEVSGTDEKSVTTELRANEVEACPAVGQLIEALFWGVLLQSMPLQHNNLTAKTNYLSDTAGKNQNFPLHTIFLVFTEYILGTVHTVI